LTPLLTSDVPPKFPFLTLLISGGHTLLLLATSKTEFKILATTLDAAIGRCIDRTARLLNIKWGYVGYGAALEIFVNEDPNPDVSDIPPFPKPIPKQLAFSFGGYHSHMERYLKRQGGIEDLDIPHKRRLARAFQTSVFAQLEQKVLLALDWCFGQDLHVHDLVVSGGVASNQYFRQR
jgi:N6-L-threonylcarbamoyladenine synthase